MYCLAIAFTAHTEWRKAQTKFLPKWTKQDRVLTCMPCHVKFKDFSRITIVFKDYKLNSTDLNTTVQILKHQITEIICLDNIGIKLFSICLFV